ncbi:MAG TPA: hypothetical protein VNW47_13175 [Terriglobales bacterium]|nr:hypothetical protein [Terriglobales bacterium]
MKSLIRVFIVFLSALAFVSTGIRPTAAQTLAKRLILKDGSYQLASKYEIKGDRVRYFSAERGEWEEIPKNLIDWDATDKYEKGRLEGAPAPEAVALDKELEAEQKAEEARSPKIAPGLHLPEDGGVFLLDTYQSHPQLDEIHQSGGDLNKNTKSNILRAAINPLASAKQTIELDGARAKIQSHTTVPAIYVNIDPVDANGKPVLAPGETPPPPAVERFKIVRAEIKNGKRIAGGIKIAPYGKVKADERFVPATVQELTGGWVKVSPQQPLATGEYAVVEMLGKEGMNLYVWDFGVNPTAPPNTSALKPDAREEKKTPDAPEDLKKRD